MIYQDALDQAVGYASTLKRSILVMYFPTIDSFGPYGLTDFVQAGNPGGYTIAASVDHNGFITESDWIKAKLQEVAA